ncbi:MAG: hypothetical protein ACRDBG_20395 [Waterburya sp.]
MSFQTSKLNILNQAEMAEVVGGYHSFPFRKASRQQSSGIDNIYSVEKLSKHTVNITRRVNK